MNKRLFLGVFVAAGMLLATSCSKDELEIVQSGTEAQVTFTLGLEGDMATRAISDGSGADVLMYAVFDSEGMRISTIEKVSKTGVTFPATENITLAKGQTYKVAFWAQDGDCQAYSVSDDMNVTVNYANNENKVNNDETRDAFFKTVEFTVMGNQKIDVELKRPFAQVNVGVTADDWNAAVASGITIERSSVVIKNAATSINLLTGQVGPETTDVTVTYEANAIPNEILKVDTDGNGTKEEYQWLSMSYILVADRNGDTNSNGVLGDERATLESLEYTFVPNSGNNITFADGLNSVPVQRNWRTNILGKILTGDIKFNITLDPVYDGDNDVVIKSDAQSLAEILTANKEDIVAVLGTDIDLPITSLGSITPGSGEYKLGGADTENITIDLNGNTLNITTTYWSAIGAVNPEATITIKNGTMTSTGNSTGTWNGFNVRFCNCNYVLEDVTFEKPIALDNAGKSTTIENVTITDNGDRYAIWITAEGQDVEIDGLDVKTTGRGIKIDEQYVDSPEEVTLDISNSTFETAKKAAVIVKSVEGATINWGAGNDISKVAADTKFAVWVDEASKDYADKVVVNGAYVRVEGTVEASVSTVDEMIAALANSNVAYIKMNNRLLPSASFNHVNENIIDGQGNYIWGGTFYSIKTSGGIIQNLGFWQAEKAINVVAQKSKVVLNNVKVVSNYNCNYAIHADEGNGFGLEATDCEFYSYISYVNALGDVKFTNCTFGANKNGSTGITPYAPTEFVDCEFNTGYPINNENAACTFENCTLNGVAITSANIGDLVNVVSNATIK